MFCGTDFDVQLGAERASRRRRRRRRRPPPFHPQTQVSYIEVSQVKALSGVLYIYDVYNCLQRDTTLVVFRSGVSSIIDRLIIRLYQTNALHLFLFYFLFFLFPFFVFLRDEKMMFSLFSVPCLGATLTTTLV